MINMQETELYALAVHRVGNQSSGGGLHLSERLADFDEPIADLLRHYFIAPFKSEEYFHFFHQTNLSLNEVYMFVSEIFDHPDALLEQSVNLAKHLYEKSTHPKIKQGEFYTVYFKNCFLDGEITDAVGLFKSENKDTFLKVFSKHNGFDITSENGLNINKLDKGCLIFNREKDKGFIVAIVDNTNRAVDAQYWTDEFLHVLERKDKYFNTNTLLSVYKNFVKEELPKQFEVSKIDQADLLNKSMKFFKEKDKFDLTEFLGEVIQQPEVIKSFDDYKSNHLRENFVEIAEDFPISDFAVKKQAKVFKSIIKLDKNFHIYVHGGRQMIEQGSDANGKFYKLYYREEI